MRCLSWFPVLFCGALFAGAALAEETHLRGIPYKPDPPPAIDGRLEEWENVPGACILDRKAQVVHGAAAWRSPRDLSAKVWLAWREEYLYLAADVTDDRHVQQGRGIAMWRGDHVELYLDATPDNDPARTAWGRGQIHLGFSPGSLQQTGDPLTDLPPEAVVFYPEGAAAQGVLVAAQKTEKGYALEAAIPWTLIAQLARQPALRAGIGLPLGFEVGISDTDGSEAAQEKLMTILTAPWGHFRNRLIAAALSGTDGKAPQIVRSVDLAKGAVLAPNEKTEIRFQSSAAPPGRESVLSLKARLDTPRVAGYASALRLRLNGEVVDPRRLLNRHREETSLAGRIMTPSAGECFNVCYAPDFDGPDRSASYALRSGAKLCQFDLRVSDLLRPRDNSMVIENRVLPELHRKLILADVRLEIRAPVEPPSKRPPPSGPLDVVTPEPRRKVDYRLVALPGATMELVVGGEKFRVESEFSTPQPAWVKASNAYFDFHRQTEQLDEAIVVRDTFTNRTAVNLPLSQRHRVFLPGGCKKVWLSGLSPAGLVSSSADPANPTSYGVTGRAGVGLMAIDDVSQVHVLNFSGKDHVGWADNQRVLKPGATHTVRWAILPTARPDYWAMVNAARRLRDVNFTLDGSFAFLRAYPKILTGAWSDRQFVDFIRYKDARFACDTYGWPTYKGRFPHGTAFQTIDYSYFRKQMARLRGLAPQSKHIMYFHCFIDVRDEAPEAYADARLLGVDGVQADYGKPYDRIFVPTTANAFGRDVAKNVDLILGPLPKGFGCEGVFWDEFEYSRYQYHYDDFRKPTGLPWDGVSADIDPGTLKITRLKSNVTLISQPYRLALAQRILRNGQLIANGQPFTETMVKLHFPRFVETGSISRCAATHLFSPIALGDHLTERSERDAYHVMLRALDFGCVYYWYNDVTVIPTHPHLTHYMFPITPLELHEGYIIGRERIVTNRSGRFGWGDNSRHEVHVFDDQGCEVPGFKAPTVVESGMTLTELRLPEDYSAAVLRK
jgi:hypothetical protein